MKLNGLAAKLISSATAICFFVGVPFHLDFTEMSSAFAPSIAFAKSGGGDGGDGGDGNSGSGSSGSGNSGSGSSGKGKSGSTGTNTTSGSATGHRVGNQPESSGQGGKETDIEVRHNNGWTEKIQAGRYILKDAIDRLVIERAATKKDTDRLNDGSDR